MDPNQLPPGLAGYVMAQQQNQQRGMQDLQSAHGVMGILYQQAQMEEAAKKRALVDKARGILSTTPEGALTGAQKATLVEAGMLPATALFKQDEPFTLKPGERRIGAGGQVLAEVPAKPEPVKKSPLAQLIEERDSLPQGHPNRTLYDTAITRATTHQPLVNVDTRQETEFSKKLGNEFGDIYAGLAKADMNAGATIGKYQRLSSLLGQVNTGKFKGTTTDIKAAAKGLGIDLNSIGVTDDVAPAQAARGLSSQLALELRNPAGGAGMPGALSDRDLKFLEQMVPSLENDPKAIGQMIDYRTKLAQREQQVARMARAYKKKNGKFDDGFFDELQDWSSKNHLFQEAPKPTVAPAAGVVDFGSLK